MILLLGDTRVSCFQLVESPSIGGGSDVFARVAGEDPMAAS